MRLDPIVMCPYDPEWAASFASQRERIEPLVAGWTTRGVEHMGSTAVPGLPAKPIIDMLAVVADIETSPRWLAFRDYLRSHPEAVSEYAALKTRLAAVHGHDPNARDAYRQGKSDFIRNISRIAIDQGLPRLDRT